MREGPCDITLRQDNYKYFDILHKLPVEHMICFQAYVPLRHILRYDVGYLGKGTSHQLT